MVQNPTFGDYTLLFTELSSFLTLK